MLRISRRMDYALRLMVAIARAPYGTYTPAPRVGPELGIPRPFLVKVVGDLKRGGLILTAAGRNGGIRLARPADKITLRHIVEAVEGPILLNGTLPRKGQADALHRTWERVQGVLQAEMDAITLAALVREHQSADQTTGSGAIPS